MEPRITTFAERLKEAMRLRGITASELARMTGIGESDISRYRSAKYEAAQENLQKLAEALDVSIPWLMGFDVPMSTYQRVVSGDMDTDAFRNRMRAEYGVLFDLVDKADDTQREQIEKIIKAIVPEDDWEGA